MDKHEQFLSETGKHYFASFVLNGIKFEIFYLLQMFLEYYFM